MEFLNFLKNFLKNYCGEQAGEGGSRWLGAVGYFTRWNSKKSAQNVLFDVIFAYFHASKR